MSSVTIEGVPAPRANRKPRLLVRGRRRSALMSGLVSLQVLFNQDQAESRRASTRKYTPYLILGKANSRTFNALSTLLEGLEAAREAKA